VAAPFESSFPVDAPALPPLARDQERTPASRLLLAVSALIALGLAAPLFYLVVRTVDLGDAAVDVLLSDDAFGPLVRTLVLAASVSLACALLGTTVAWLVVRTDLPARRVFRVIVALPLVIPSFVGALALLAAFAPGGLVDEIVGFGRPPRIEGFAGAFFVLTVLSYPYVYLPTVARLSGLPPELEETARSLGRTPRVVFRTIVLPLCWGAIGAGTLLVFLYVVSDFGAVSLMRYDALTRTIEATRVFDRTTSLTLSMILATVALAIAAAERSFARRRSIVESVSAGRRAYQAELGPWRIPALAFVGTLVAVALVAPLAVLGVWAWRGFSGRGRFSGPGVSLSELGTPLLNTTLISVVAALVTLALVLPIAYLTVRHRSRISGALDILVVAGFALPGLVIALSLVFWVLQSSVLNGLYQTFALLVFAYAVHFGAQAIRGAQVAIAGVPTRLDDAARSLGAGRTRRFVDIELPLMRPGLAAAGGLVLLSCMKELPATLLLAPIGFDTLATRIWSAGESGFLARAGLASLVLVAASAILTWFLTIRPLGRVDKA
jgi:iron(III) transport system permease protein